MDRTVIDRYASGGATLRQAIAGLSAADLQAVPPAEKAAEVGRWSIQQVVIHLADCELVIADRIRRVVAEDQPTLMAFDQDRWVERLAYADQSVDDAVAMVELIRRQTARMLNVQPDAVLHRQGVHNVTGPVSVLDLVTHAIQHLEHHVGFIQAKRRWLETRNQ